MDRLKNKVMIITGAGKGIGASAAKLSANEGATVILTDIDLGSISHVAEDIRTNGGEAIAVKHDVADENAWKEVVKKVIDSYGKIDVLVNNAGIATPKNILELDAAEWEKIQKVDLDSAVYGMRQVLPQMKKQQGGSIINVSSIGGIVGMARTSPYTAAKGALRSLSKAAAVDFGKDNIRVNSVHPGVIATPMTAESIDDASDYYMTFTQLPHLGEPDDIGYGIVFLASDESKFMTGAELVIDGGWTAI